MYSADVLTSQVIIKRIKDDLQNPANRVEGSLGADNAQAVGKEIAKYYAYVEWLNDMHYVETATGVYLDRKAVEAGIYRKQATKSVGVLRCYGAPGSVIPRGTIFYSETQRFSSLMEKVIGEEGYVEVDIEAVEPGENGNVGPGAITEFDSVDGLVRVENLEATINGTDIESDENLRERTLLKMRYPGTSGNVYHYMHWAMEVEGVGRVKVFPLWDGNGTVKVSILDSNQRKASLDLMEKVKTHIDGDGGPMGEALAPIGATLTVSTATEKVMNVVAKIVPIDDGIVSMDGIEEAMKAILTDYFEDVSYDAERITVAKVIDILLGIDGVIDVIECTVNGLATSLPLGEEEIPVVGEVVIS